jgi:putative SOS response-associated peptidase YedK
MFENDELEEEFGIKPKAVDWLPNENVSPGEGVPVITDATERELKIMRWGLVPSWAKDPMIGYKLINARAETVSEKPSFRNSFTHRRCLIPASGFYEWLNMGGRKQPYKFTLKDQKLFSFAGLWDHWQDGKGKELITCSIITTVPNKIVAEYHDRMPVILDKEHYWEWLEDRTLSELQAMLVPYPVEKMAEPIMVNPMFFKKTSAV